MTGGLTPTIPLELRALGDCVAVRATGDDPGTFGRGKPLALLVYLASMPGRAATRDELVGLLWADVDREAGRHALRQTAWYIRKRLGDDVLVGDTQSLSIGCPVDFDRNALLDAVNAGDCSAAVAAYAGEFLPAFAVPGGVRRLPRGK